MAVLYTPHYMQFFDNDGITPLAGGKLYTYEAGTTTPKATYTTADGLTANTNPVVLDSIGRATIFISGSYKFRLTDSDDVLIKETDNISAFSSSAASVEGITTNYTEAVIATGDSVLFADASDGNATRRDTVQGIIDLVSSAGGLVAIKTVTVSSPVSSVDFVNGSGGVVLDGTYKNYMIAATNLIPSSDGATLFLRTSSNAGSSYDQAGSDYAYALYGFTSANAILSSASQNNGQISLSASGLGTATGENYNAIVFLYNPSGTSVYPCVYFQISHFNSDGNLAKLEGAGIRKAAADVDAIQFTPSSGNIASGVFTLYGIKGA